MDIDMPGMNGFQTVEWLKENHPTVKIMVVSMLDTEEAILQMLKLGVKGYLSKNIDVEDMNRALQAIVNGQIHYSGFVSEVITNMHLHESKESSEPNFKETELEFLRYICTDMTYDQIADKMCKSIKTIDGYRAGFFKKFDVKSRQGLAVYVISNHIITTDDLQGL